MIGVGNATVLPLFAAPFHSSTAFEKQPFALLQIDRSSSR
jgi:hypothetical protein